MVPSTHAPAATLDAAVPLFPGIPGGAELLLVFLLLTLLFVGLGIGLGIWVYRDAAGRRNDAAGLWGALVAIAFLAGLFPGVAALGAYLVLRGSGSPSR
jgi:ABC-type Na+ efflux pump permease subunit